MKMRNDYEPFVKYMLSVVIGSIPRLFFQSKITDRAAECQSRNRVRELIQQNTMGTITKV